MQREATEVKKTTIFKLSRVVTGILWADTFPNAQYTRFLLYISWYCHLVTLFLFGTWDTKWKNLFKGFTQKLRNRSEWDKVVHVNPSRNFLLLCSFSYFPIQLIRIFGIWSSSTRFVAYILQFDCRWHVIEYLYSSQNRICENWRKRERQFALSSRSVCTWATTNAAARL